MKRLQEHMLVVWRNGQRKNLGLVISSSQRGSYSNWHCSIKLLDPEFMGMVINAKQIELTPFSFQIPKMTDENLIEIFSGIAGQAENLGQEVKRLQQRLSELQSENSQLQKCIEIGVEGIAFK